MTRYAVFRLNTDGQRENRIGQIELAAGNRLELTEADPEATDDINEAIEDLNDREVLIVKLPPAPGGSRFGIRKEEVARSDPGFLDAVQDNLRRWHGMELAAE